MVHEHYLIDITGVEVGGEMYAVKGWGWTPENRSMTPDRVLVDSDCELRVSAVTASITNEDGCIQQHQHGEDNPIWLFIRPDMSMLFEPLTRPCGEPWGWELTNECECCAPSDA